jgi:hypothetical protein
MTSIRKPGWPTSSPASPNIRRASSLRQRDSPLGSVPDQAPAHHDFMRFTGINRPEEFRTDWARMTAWRDYLAWRDLGAAVRHRLAGAVHRKIRMSIGRSPRYHQG